MKKKFASLLVAPLFVCALHGSAQVQDNQNSNSIGQSAVDCSDPMEAGSADCVPISQQQQLSRMPSGSGGLSGTQSQPGANQNSTYTDLENPNRQALSRNALLPRNTPPEPLTEFQKFVASTTGQVLPIFGASLFRQVPSTFAPLDMTPVPPDYAIGPGDVLRIRVWGQVNFRADVRVDRAGDVYLPQVGRIHVAGMPFSALDGHLRSAIARIYRNFDLTADVGQIRAIQVYVAGQARHPGVYTVSSLSTLVDALFASGGPSPAGSLRHIELRRGGTTVTDFDLYSLLVQGDKSKDVPLQSGDVLFIPPAGQQVAITGSVRSPGIYEIRQGETLSSAIADAGSASTIAAETRVSIERTDNHRDRYAMEVKYDEAGLATPLADGDLVRVFSIVPQYQNTVTLRGNTANPGRFAWHEGMRVSDLIPDKDSLITRNYWWKRAQLGLPTQEFEPLQYFPNLKQPNTPIDLSRRRMLGQRPNAVTPLNPAAAQTGSIAEGQAEQTYPASQDQSQVPYPDALQSEDLQGLPAAAGDPPQSANPSGVPRARTSSALGSEQAELEERGAESTRTEVGRIAPEIDWDYAVIERLDPQTLRTELLQFDLGKLVLRHDQSQNLPLMPGDVVSIMSQADIRVPVAQQTKFVRLDGEFVHSGVYTVRPGETLRDLVKRAGGFTANAYLYGSEFTRDSTRIAQQHRLDEYIATLQLQMQRGNLALASSPAASAQDLASGAAAQSSEQELLKQLRQMRATGRIVLEFKPGSSGLDTLPDIALEDGDRFIVPPVPASINVVGSVYDQNSFLYASSRRAGTYLRLAGGPNRDADQKRIFIIRADGSVVSRESANGLWGNEFDSLRMNPGDTIVVPDKSFRPSALRGFLDYSQLFSQFAFGAAALSVINF